MPWSAPRSESGSPRTLPNAMVTATKSWRRWQGTRDDLVRAIDLAESLVEQGSHFEAGTGTSVALAGGLNDEGTGAGGKPGSDLEPRFTLLHGMAFPTTEPGGRVLFLATPIGGG